MKRRDLLRAAALAALPWQKVARAAELPGWRNFEMVTRVDVVKARGTSRAWLPLPQPMDSEWQRTRGNTWKGNASRAEEVTAGKYAVPMLAVEWTGVDAPYLEVTSRFSTRDRAADLSRKNVASLSDEEIALYTAPSEYIPCDGIVRQTALTRAARGAVSDLEKGRAIYQWVVDHTRREAKAKGCGVGNIKALLESGNLGGKCADINGLFVGLCRSLGIPARDLYGIRVAPSRLGYTSLGANSETITKAQHCRAEFFAEGIGWVPVDPADVRKVVLDEHAALDDAKVVAARARLFGSWEMNWVAFNTGHDVALPGSRGPKVPFLLYPNGETGGERLDQLDADHFKYAITAREV